MRHYRAGLWKGKGQTWWIFFRQENQHVPINTRCTRRVVTLQPPPVPVPDLPQTRERVRRRYDCQPRTFSETLLGWLVAEDVPLSTVSPVVITKYFTGIVAGQWKRTTVSFHVQSLRSFFRYASSRGWCAAGIAESIDAPPVNTYENLPQGPAWELHVIRCFLPFPFVPPWSGGHVSS